MKMRPPAFNKQQLLPWQQECCNLKKGHSCASPLSAELHAKFEGGLKIFISQMFDSFRDVFLTMIF